MSIEPRSKQKNGKKKGKQRKDVDDIYNIGINFRSNSIFKNSMSLFVGTAHKIKIYLQLYVY